MSKILPKKHILLEQSYIGFGSIILANLDIKHTLDELWYLCNTNEIKHAFKDLILTLDCLYALGIITVDNEGYICLN